MRIFGFVIFACLVFLSYDLYYGRNGMQEYDRLSAQLEQEKIKADKLTRRNLALQEELKDLQQGSIAIEELARSELGLIKPGEDFYRIIEPKSK